MALGTTMWQAPGRRYLVSIRRVLRVLAAATVVVAPVSAAFEMPAWAATAWTTPRHIPGSTGQANPIGATARDGTSVVVWAVGTGVGTLNAVHARVRLAGRATWRDVPGPLTGSYLQGIVVIPASGGDFWIAYERELSDGFPQVFVSKLDSSARRWSSPERVFGQRDYGHGGPSIGRAGDGTLVVAAYAPPKVPPPGDPVYRVAVATKAPGGAWHGRFLTHADTYAGSQRVAVNSHGDIVVSFIQGYHVGTFTVRASTKAHGSHATWETRTLSATGDGQFADPTIDAHGTAAVVWTDNVTQKTVRLSTIHVEAAHPAWVRRDVITETAAFTVEPHAVIAPSGHITVVWRRSTGPEVTLWARTLAHGSFDAAEQLSPSGEVAEFDGLRQRPDGKAALLYQAFTPGISSLGLRFRTLSDGVPGPEKQLTGDEATDGDSNSEYLGIDGHSRATVIYTRGSYPHTDFAWLAQVTSAP